MAIRFWRKTDSAEDEHEQGAYPPNEPQQAEPPSEPAGADALPGSAGYRGGLRGAKHPERFTYSPIRPEPRDERGEAP